MIKPTFNRPAWHLNFLASNRLRWGGGRSPPAPPRGSIPGPSLRGRGRQIKRPKGARQRASGVWRGVSPSNRLRSGEGAKPPPQKKNEFLRWEWCILMNVLSRKRIANDACAAIGLNRKVGFRRASLFVQTSLLLNAVFVTKRFL